MSRRRYTLVILFAFSSCIRRDHKYFSNCVGHENIAVNKKLHTNGYYYSLSNNGVNVQIFYPDGSSLYAGNFADTKQAEENMSRTDAKFYKHLYWGRYNVYGDTIKDQYFSQKEMFLDVVQETWYIINSDSSLTSITAICKRCTGMTNVNKYGIVTDFNSQTWHFVSSSHLPSSTHSFINKKRWSQCSRKRYQHSAQ